MQQSQISEQVMNVKLKGFYDLTVILVWVTVL